MAALSHGTPSAYNRGCRCEVCKAARTERARKYRAAKPVETAVAAPAAKPARAARVSRPAPPPEPPPAPARIPGPVEKALTAELADHADKPGVWFATYKAAALSLAKALDDAEPALAARLYPQLLDALGRIGINPPARPAADTGPAAAPAPALLEPDEPDALAGIRIQGRSHPALLHPA